MRGRIDLLKRRLAKQRARLEHYKQEANLGDGFSQDVIDGMYREIIMRQNDIIIALLERDSGGHQSDADN